MDIKKEKTLVIIKPDGIQRGMIGDIIKRYERSGLKLVALKLAIPSEKLIDAHYSTDPEWKQKAGEKAIAAYRKKGKTPPSEDPTEVGQTVFNNLLKYVTAGPVVAMVWQGMHAVEIVRKITGGTEPLTSNVGTIRGDLTIDSYAMADIDNRAVRNLIHASGSHTEAEAEIKLWFTPEEIFNYRLINEAILYDVNLDGILE